MSTSLLEPPTNSSPQTALHLTQQAPSFLSSQKSWLSKLPYPLSLFINTESQEKWQIYENLFLAALRTGDNETAFTTLEEISRRFGATKDRVLALKGLYMEATASTPAQLQAAMDFYEAVLKEDPTVFSVRKRRAALLRSDGKLSEAATALTNLLAQSPTDAEAWAELADLYLAQGMYEQAIFSLEEVLLVTPNAWNMHARLAEVLFLGAGRLDKGASEQIKMLVECMRRFCRSVELCDDYLRGYYGLKLCTTRLLALLEADPKKAQQPYSATGSDLPPPKLDSIKRLNILSTIKLTEILRKGTAKEPGWDGVSTAEMIAVRELLDRDTQQVQR